MNDSKLATAEERIAAALHEAMQWGDEDGAHHKAYVIDQMVRHLTGCPTVTLVNPTAVGGPLEYQGLGESAEYLAWVAEHNAGEDGPDTYEWDEGIAP